MKKIMLVACALFFAYNRCAPAIYADKPYTPQRRNKGLFKEVSSGACTLDRVRWLLEGGADVNFVQKMNPPDQSVYSYSVLMAAAASGNYQVVKELLTRGANYAFVNELGDTAWVIAYRNSRSQPSTGLSEKIIGCRLSMTILERYAYAQVGLILSMNKKSAEKHAYEALPELPPEIVMLIGLCTMAKEAK